MRNSIIMSLRNVVLVANQVSGMIAGMVDLRALPGMRREVSLPRPARAARPDRLRLFALKQTTSVWRVGTGSIVDSVMTAALGCLGLHHPAPAFVRVR